MELEKGSVGRNNHIRLHLVLGLHLQMLCVDQKAFGFYCGPGKSCPFLRPSIHSLHV